MRTRRNLLAAVGTGVLGGLAGCAGLLDTDSNSEPDIDVDDFRDWTPPDPGTSSRLPVSLGEDTWAAHRTRASTLLRSVPENPSIPNGVVNEHVRSERATLATQVESAGDQIQPLETLARWRRIRGDVANLSGVYRAATGQDDAESVRRRRQASRERLADRHSTIEYRARTPIEGVLVYAQVEDRLERASRETRPRARYPDTPVANVEQAGDAVEAVETAAASLDDAEAIHGRYLDGVEAVEPQWHRLLTALDELDYTIDRTWSERVDFLEADETQRYGTELRGIQSDLHRLAIRELRHREGDVRDHERDGRPASGVLEAGRTLASIAAAEGVDEGLRDGAIAQSPTVATVKTAAQNAVEALQTLGDQPHPHLAVAVGLPALNGYLSAVSHLEESYYGVEYIEAQFRFATLFAHAARSASSFVAARCHR
jgi:hypothetical protein